MVWVDETGLQGGGEWAALCGGGEAQLGHQLGLRVQVEAVAEAVQQGGVADVAAGLPKEEAARLQEVLSDKKKAETLPNSPQAQKLMQQLFDNKKK